MRGTRFIGHVGGRLGTAYAPNAEGSLEDIRVMQMGVAYAPNAEGSAEGDKAWYGNGSSRRVRMISGRYLGTAYAPAAEGYAEEGLRGLREDDAGIRLQGLREDDAGIRLQGLREDDAGIRLGGLREDDAGIRLQGLREDDAGIRLQGLREDDAGIRLGGLREDDAGIRLGAADFHPRFPVEFKVNGERVVANMSNQELSGIFDFLKSLPSPGEWGSRLQILEKKWIPIRKRIFALPQQQREALEKSMWDMRSTVHNYDTAVNEYLPQGAASINSTNVRRLDRIEAALPTIENTLSQMELLRPASTQEQADDQVKEIIIREVRAQDDANKAQYAVPPALLYGGIAVGGTFTLFGLGKLFRVF